MIDSERCAVDGQIGAGGLVALEYFEARNDERDLECNQAKNIVSITPRSLATSTSLHAISVIVSNSRDDARSWLAMSPHQ